MWHVDLKEAIYETGNRVTYHAFLILHTHMSVQRQRLRQRHKAELQRKKEDTKAIQERK